MKIISYYIFLLVFILLLGVFLFYSPTQTMSMSQMISVSVLLGVYVVFISFVGEYPPKDEREVVHRYRASRGGLLVGTIILSAGLLVELFNHAVDPWLLAGLIGINVTKIILLIHSHYRE